MFERYTEKARRVIFFARYEATVWGGELIDTSHLLLGLWREDKTLFFKLLHGDPLDNAAETLGLEKSGKFVSVSTDMPLSAGAIRVIAFAAEEADSMGDQHIGTGHLLLGLLREPGAARQLLEARGVEWTAARKVVADKERTTATTPTNRQIVSLLRADFEAALAGRLKAELEPAVRYTLRMETPK